MTQLDRVRHLDKLQDALGRAGVDVDEVCITGSTVLTLCGVKENPDIDFIATGPAREKLRELMDRDPGSRYIPGVRGEIGDHLELSIRHRLSQPPYLFGLTDEAIIQDPQYHWEIEGFKFLRPELVLSMKGAKRRPKDIGHIHMIQDSGIMDEDWWDWNLVQVVPPWDRSFATEEAKRGLIPRDTVLHNAWVSLRDDGVAITLQRAIEMVRDRLAPVQRAAARFRGRVGHGYPPPLTWDLELGYPLPNLISRQYDDAGRLLWDDGPDPGLEITDPWTGLDIQPGQPVVTREGNLIAGHGTLERRMASWDEELPRDAPDKRLPVHVVPKAPGDRAFRASDAGGAYRVVQGDEKLELLERSAAAFHAVLWPSLHEHFERAQRLIGSSFEIIGIREVELGGRWPLDRFIEETYSRDDRTEEWFMRNRINRLSKFEPVLRIVTLEVPDPTFVVNSGAQVAKEVFDRKMRFRKEISTWLEDYIYATCLHMTDNFRHNAHIAHLLSQVEASPGCTVTPLS